MKAQIGSTAQVLILSEPRTKYAYVDGKRSTQVERDPATNLDVATVRVAANTPFGLVEATAWIPTSTAPTARTEALAELTGQLEMEIAGGDFGATRNTIRGIENIKVLGDFTSAITALANAKLPAQKA
ncbi:hypothetical protein C5U48_20710 [Mycolicibacter virginiensis]|uniref:Uncharacterized protein n=1 Tax=Mycolicibacter virginiensis TaxID=1795032 RepID=A0A9X7NWU3_9MYCO|nr:hypothetical protein [Mycolicibacter virginiensis]PQM50303.1 hypothetical protein C5U48_20710 [Mycolicibacter virginiensis]